jgi:hypothetical protein
MSVARVTEISATSKKSFEDAVVAGVGDPGGRPGRLDRRLQGRRQERQDRSVSRQHESDFRAQEVSAEADR